MEDAREYVANIPQAWRWDLGSLVLILRDLPPAMLGKVDEWTHNSSLNICTFMAAPSGSSRLAKLIINSITGDAYHDMAANKFTNREFTVTMNSACLGELGVTLLFFFSDVIRLTLSE